MDPMPAVLAVLAVLSAALWWLRRKGAVRFRRAGGGRGARRTADEAPLEGRAGSGGGSAGARVGGPVLILGNATRPGGRPGRTHPDPVADDGADAAARGHHVGHAVFAPDGGAALSAAGARNAVHSVQSGADRLVPVSH